MPVNKQNNFLYNILIEPKFRIGRHMLFIVMFSFIAIGQSLFVFGNQMEALGNKTYWFGAGNVMVILTFVYFNLYVLAPHLLLKNKYVEYFITLITVTALYIAFKGTIESYILLQIGIVRNLNGVTFLDGLSNVTLYTICIASSSFTILFKQWISDIKTIDDLENKRLKNSVDELKNQINPKSLSNVLDYVSERVKTDPKKVSDILFRLSDVLRYELYDCKREKVLLESDIEFINKYLSLEQLNSQNQFTYTLSATGKTNLFVSPFIFIRVVQEIIEQHPTDILIHFDVYHNLVKFECKVTGADLTRCDFSKEQQRLGGLYHKVIKIRKNDRSVGFQLEIC